MPLNVVKNSHYHKTSRNLDRKGNPTMLPNQALTNDQMRAIAPAIFSESASPRRSAKFGLIPTLPVLDALRGEGYAITKVQQTRTVDADNMPFARHLIRLCRVKDLDMFENVGDTRREVVLSNCHGFGGRAFDLYIGLYRLACRNGMIVAQGEFAHLKIWHTPNMRNAIDNVIEGSFRILEHGEQVMEQVGDMKKIELAHPQQLALAERAHSLRFPDRIDKKGVHKSPFTPADLLHVRRNEDVPGDLWTTYNVIQENALAGLMHTTDEKNHKRVSRPVRAIGDTVRINQALWGAAVEMMAESQASRSLVLV